MNSGNDSIDNINTLYEWGVSFIIKRNHRRENKQNWLTIAKEPEKPNGSEEPNDSSMT